MASEGAEKSFEHIDKVLAAVDAMADVVQYDSHKWHWKKLREYAKGLFDRGPFKVGDRVRLRETPEINQKDSWGWMHAKHFLVKGAEGVVGSVDFADGRFHALVAFDNETHLSDLDHKEYPVTRKGFYCFGERWLEKLPTPGPSKEEP